MVVPTRRELSCGRPYGERAKLWSSLWGESQVVVVPTRREPSFGCPYGERAKSWSSLRGESQVFYGVQSDEGKALMKAYDLGTAWKVLIMQLCGDSSSPERLPSSPEGHQRASSRPAGPPAARLGWG
ncbi:hypothetical protein Tco_0935328 [Tanacetum coccineum]